MLARLFGIRTAFLGLFLSMLLGLFGCAQNPLPNQVQITQAPYTQLISEKPLVDLSKLKSSDGQPLFSPPELKTIPDFMKTQPQNAVDSFLWEYEFVGYDGIKENIPLSPNNGTKDKNIVMISTDSHPFWTGVGIGAKKIADVYKMNFRMLCPFGDSVFQERLVEQAIAQKPDMIFLAAINPASSTELFKKINDAGIPAIAFSTIPSVEALHYALAWTGADDWGQMRMLGMTLADKLNKKGGVAYFAHFENTSKYYTRLYGIEKTLNQYAPQIKTLDVVCAGYDQLTCKETVLKWIERFDNSLNAIVCADDVYQIPGVIEAIEESGRKDITVVASGSSKIGMDAVKEQDVYAITYQSAEADGAACVNLAADWFNGKKVNQVSYLRKYIITKNNVDNFMPAQY